VIVNEKILIVCRWKKKKTIRDFSKEEKGRGGEKNRSRERISLAY